MCPLALDTGGGLSEDGGLGSMLFIRSAAQENWEFAFRVPHRLFVISLFHFRELHTSSSFYCMAKNNTTKLWQIVVKQTPMCTGTLNVVKRLCVYVV